MNMAKKRPNIIPIIEDARHPQKYRMLVPMVDVVFAGDPCVPMLLREGQRGWLPAAAQQTPPLLRCACRLYMLCHMTAAGCWTSLTNQSGWRRCGAA